MKISGALICKNEERCIKRCLDSYKHIADELIVVDTGSTDRTVEIAEECGATVLHFDWINDFSAARNYALDHCTGDWIIFLDADEWFQEGQADTLLQYIKRYHGDRRYQAFTLFMHNIDIDRRKKGRSEFDSIHQSLRVMRRLRGLRYEGKIHERLQYGDKEINTMRLAREAVTLLHDGYRAENIRAKGERNVKANIETWEETKNPDYLHYAAMDLCNLDEYEEALRYFNMFFDTGYYSFYFGTYPHRLAIRAMHKLDYPEEEIAAFIEKTAEQYPKNAGAQFYKADYYFEKHRYDEAYALYEQVDKLLGKSPEEHLDFGFTIGGEGYSRIFCNMALMQSLKGDVEAARRLYERALGWRKDDRKAVEGLVWLLRKQTPENALAYWQQRYNLGKLEDVTTLMRAYGLRKPGVEYLLLFEKYFAMTNTQDLHFFTMLLIIGEYKQAFDALSNRHVTTSAVNYGVKALMASYLAGHLEWNAHYESFYTESFKKLPEVLQGKEELSDAQYSQYLLFITELVKYLEPGDTRLSAALTPVLKLGDKEKLPYIDMMEETDHNTLTLELLDSLVSDTDAVRLQEYRLRAMLAYKLEDFAAVKDYIASARELPLQDGIFDVYEKWTKEKEAQSHA